MHVHQPSKGRSKLLTLHQTFARLLVAERQSRSLPASTSHNNVKSKCSGKNSDLKRMISSRRPPPWPPRGRAPPAPPQIAPSAHRRCKKKNRAIQCKATSQEALYDNQTAKGGGLFRFNTGLRELIVKFVAGVSQFGFQGLDIQQKEGGDRVLGLIKVLGALEGIAPVARGGRRT
jgi:hypothetical protein